MKHDATNPLLKLQKLGQSIWIDFISRGMLISGEFQSLIDEDGLLGVTSNPSIFEKSIAESHDYDEAIRAAYLQGKGSKEIYQLLTVGDVQKAADLFLPIFENSKHEDGYVSLEVSPHLAHDTEGTIQEAKKLWASVSRPNALIKVPATNQGVPAIKELISEGISVNVTLLFDLNRYDEVIEAYLSGLESRVALGRSVLDITSVASFFLSRIDAKIDPLLDKIIRDRGPHATMASQLLGEVAILNAKLAYQKYKAIFHSERFEKLKMRGSKSQRLLWASTSTKNPSESDVKYVERLIGPETINTVPLKTLKAYRDHGKPTLRLELDVPEAKPADRLNEVGIDWRNITQQLEAEGVNEFSAAFDKLMSALEGYYTRNLGPEIETSVYDVGVIGLGAIGKNLLLNMADHGYPAIGLDNDKAKVSGLKSEAHSANINATTDVKVFLSKLSRPRAVILLVPAGAAVDSVLKEFTPLLTKGDLVIDAGNSHFKDTDSREKSLAEKGISFMGMGVSGGNEGARKGPSLMPGGDKTAYERVRTILEAIAAKVNGEPCVTYLGPGSAGHYVKMVHNGIEYGLMQLIAETYHIMKMSLSMSDEECHCVYAEWDDSELSSFLLEITAQIFLKKDVKTGKPLIDIVLDVARQTGTGKWACQDAMDLQVPLSTINAAVAARDMSLMGRERKEVAQFLAGPGRTLPGDRELFLNQLKNAYYASTLITFAEGFSLLREASKTYHYDLNLETIARIWRGGCIIRAAALEEIMSTYLRSPDLPNLLLDSRWGREVENRQVDLRAIVQRAAAWGIPFPAMTASLSYYDGYRSMWLPVNLIEAQRDFFGAHRYERSDEAGAFHSAWGKV